MERDRLVLNVMMKFIRDEDGLEMVEWAIVGALIITAAATSISSLSNSVSTKFIDIDTIITALP